MSEKEGEVHMATCICPNCGYETEHRKEKPCYQISCPQCGTLMQDL
ncbi:MAG: hypothetical protein ACOC53_01545 [Candidatus Saliniplasma sp.]